MDLQQCLADISLKTMSQVHRAIVHLTGGQVLGSAFGMPVVELHTVGRKSGQPRSTMLTAPVIEGDRVVLVACPSRTPRVSTRPGRSARDDHSSFPATRRFAAPGSSGVVAMQPA
jgi:F420H(2)-dependent quinone reductase